MKQQQQQQLCQDNPQTHVCFHESLSNSIRKYSRYATSLLTLCNFRSSSRLSQTDDSLPSFSNSVHSSSRSFPLRRLQIPTEAFEALKALVSLNLSLNRITMLRSESFRGLVSLIRLTLYGNRLHTLDSAAFLSCGNNLTRLNIGRNNLTRIPAEALALIVGLQHLDLHENNISRI